MENKKTIIIFKLLRSISQYKFAIWLKIICKILKSYRISPNKNN